MKLIRNGLVVVAVAASMVLPATAAHAASALKVTSLGGPGSQGWQVDNNRTTDFAFPSTFVAGNNPPIGTGSLQYAATSPTIDAEKMYIWRTENISAADFRKVKFDYYFAPDSLVKSPSQIYLNLYVDTVALAPPAFYDCKFDYVATKNADGEWSTLAMDRADAAGTVTTKPGAVCGNSIAQLQPNDKITRIAINAGDTSPNDAGMKGGFDNVFVKAKNSEVTYDFDPGVVTPPAPVKACTNPNSLPVVDGSTRNDIKNGTGAAERIELKAGNDISDAKGGADCVVGGDGNDQLTGGAGNDEIQSGPGNDIVYVKNDGDDMVDCGGGNDIVFADSTDKVAGNCETVLPQR